MQPFTASYHYVACGDLSVDFYKKESFSHYTKIGESEGIWRNGYKRSSYKRSSTLSKINERKKRTHII